MRVKLMLVGAVALVALSAGVPGLLGGGADPRAAVPPSLFLDVEILPDEESVVATLQLDPDAPVVSVSMRSEETDLILSETGQNGLWVAEGPVYPDVDCYPVTAKVTLATVGAVPQVPTGKPKKAKKLEHKKTKSAPASGTRATKLKKAKTRKKGSSPGFEAVLGSFVLELTAESCLARVDVCDEIMN